MKLELQIPVKPLYLNQPFGGNLPCVEDRNDIPLDSRKIITGADNHTCPAGYTKLYPQLGLPNGHNGVDLMAGVQNVYASTAGTICETSLEAARGLGVGLVTDERYDMNSHGTHYAKTRYWHLKSVNVTVGQKVKIGDILGVSDTTGYSSGNHLHWELVPVEKNSSGELYNTEDNNGFFGKINPMEFSTGYYAQDFQQRISIIKQMLQKISEMLANLAKPKG